MLSKRLISEGVRELLCKSIILFLVRSSRFKVKLSLRFMKNVKLIK